MDGCCAEGEVLMRCSFVWGVFKGLTQAPRESEAGMGLVGLAPFSV